MADDKATPHYRSPALAAHPQQGFTWRLRGRVDTDAGCTHQSAANRAAIAELDGQVGLRRARIGILGNIDPATHDLSEIDLAGGDLVVRDLHLARGKIAAGGE